jgi:hypothetical protein
MGPRTSPPLGHCDAANGVVTPIHNGATGSLGGVRVPLEPYSRSFTASSPSDRLSSNTAYQGGAWLDRPGHGASGQISFGSNTECDRGAAELIARNRPTFKKWGKLANGQLLEYNGRKFYKPKDEETLLTRLVGSVLQDHRKQKKNDLHWWLTRGYHYEFLPRPYCYSGHAEIGIANGVYKFANGNVYEGEWKDRKYNGKGVYKFADEGVYDGEFKDGKYNGKGVRKYADGKVYEGEWKDDECNGKGVCKFSDGDMYDGEWKDGEFNGKGKMVYADGDVYEGEWKDGEFNGKGVMMYADGDVYEGEWKDDERNGKGVLKVSNGAGVYEGGWKDDKRDGPGILTEVNGVMSKHVYDQGALVSNKRCISSIYIASISPSPTHPSTDAVGVIPLIEQDIECQFCFNEFFTEMNTEDATAKRRLPVIGLCGHVCCYGCVLGQQTANPKINSTMVPTSLNCRVCEKVGAFHPDEPVFDRRLMDWLGRSIPVVRDEQS